MLKSLENIKEEEILPLEVAQKIANMLIDEEYICKLESGYRIPDTPYHSRKIIEPMKANTKKNKNVSIVSEDNKILASQIADFFED